MGRAAAMSEGGMSERVRERVNDRVSEMKNIDQHHHVISIFVAAASKLLTCHGTAMMNR